MRGLRSSLQVRFMAGVVCVLLLTIGGLFYLLRVYYNARLDGAVQSYASYLSRTVESSFEFATSVHSMEGIREAAQMLDKHGGVSRIFLVNRDREVVLSFPEYGVGERIGDRDPACLVCHGEPAADRQGSAVVDIGGRKQLRVAVPLRNRPACYTCHGSSPEVRGMVILDYNLDVVKGSLSPSVVGMSSLFVVTVGGLVCAIGLLMNRLTVKRLSRLESAATRIGRGDFAIRIPVEGDDEIDRLSRTFNTMADNLQRTTLEIESDRDFLDRLVNSFEDRIIVFSPSGEVVTANVAAGALGQQVFNEASRPRSGRDPDCACDPELVRRMVVDTFATTRPVRRLVSAKGSDGEDRYLELLAEPLRDGDSPGQVLFVCRDITERRALESELIRSERLASLGRLAANVAHEINNPMASVVTCAEGIIRRLKSSNGEPCDLPDLPDYMETIRKAAFETKEIARKLLDLARRPDGDTHTVDVAEILREEIDLLRPTAEEAGKDLRLQLEPGPLLVSANRTRLAHALSNLVRNGLDAVASGQSVDVSAARRAASLVVTVVDTGCGIPALDRDRVFEPFFTTKPEGKGTGLGLSIAESTIRESGGTIHVDSRVGEGTRVVVVLPFAGPGSTHDQGGNEDASPRASGR